MNEEMRLRFIEAARLLKRQEEADPMSRNYCVISIWGGRKSFFQLCSRHEPPSNAKEQKKYLEGYADSSCRYHRGWRRLKSGTKSG